MNKLILQDNNQIFENLLPLTFTRPVSEIKVGIFTIREKWQRLLDNPTIYYATDPLLYPLFPTAEADDDTLTVATHFLPTPCLVRTVAGLLPGQTLLLPSGEEIAHRGLPNGNHTEKIIYTEPLAEIRHLYDLFLLNGNEIRADISLLAPNEYAPLPADHHATIIGPIQNLFIHPTAIIDGATINLRHGPVYIGPGAVIMEGATVRGPIALCEHSEIRMGARVYEDTTIGPHCKVGGEISNVIFIAHSNKAHDGFLGNSVIGEWCNLGGGTVASNLKNDYSEIKLWNYPTRRFLRTGLQFCGLIMGDHSKTGINTMINTATVFGVGVNFHGAGYPRNFVPSFTEGSTAGMSEVPLRKFLDIAARVLARRDITLTPDDIDFYTRLHALTETYR